jgi:hypothetical protein
MLGEVNKNSAKKIFDAKIRRILLIRKLRFPDNLKL